jgi:hypothetical protein
MRWGTFAVSPEWPLECVVCERLIPDEDSDLDEEAYTLDAYDTPYEECEAFSKAFEMPDPLADFHICRGCLHRYGHFGEDGDPMEWLEAYLEEDSKLISRQEALRIVEEWP